jgi:hypothetical protein
LEGQIELKNSFNKKKKNEGQIEKNKKIKFFIEGWNWKQNKNFSKRANEKKLKIKRIRTKMKKKYTRNCNWRTKLEKKNKTSIKRIRKK